MNFNRGTPTTPRQRIDWAGVWQTTALWAQAQLATLLSMLTRATANSAAAIIIWLLGVWTTRAFLSELGVVGSTTLYAFVLQAILTNCEGPIWHSRLRVSRGGAFIIGIGALFIDILMNIGGLWIYLRNLGGTTFWQAVMATTHTNAPPTATTCFLLALVLAIGVSAGPEALWDL